MRRKAKASGCRSWVTGVDSTDAMPLASMCALSTQGIALMSDRTQRAFKRLRAVQAAHHVVEALDPKRAQVGLRCQGPPFALAVGHAAVVWIGVLVSMVPAWAGSGHEGECVWIREPTPQWSLLASFDCSQLVPLTIAPANRCTRRRGRTYLIFSSTSLKGWSLGGARRAQLKRCVVTSWRSTASGLDSRSSYTYRRSMTLRSLLAASDQLMY